MDELDKEIPGLFVSPLKVDSLAIVSDTAKITKVKDWHKTIRKDIYLNETIAIMNDMGN